MCYCFLNREVRGLVDRRWEHSSLKRTVSRRLSSVASRFTQETESNWSRSPSEKRISKNNQDNNNRYQSGDRIVQPDLTTPFIPLEKSSQQNNIHNNPHLGNQFSLLENNNNNSDNSSTSTFPNNNSNNIKQHTTTPLQTN